MDKEALLYRIDQLCEEKHIRPTAAFIESGVGKNFKTNLKTANPSRRNLMLLANYFDVSVEYLTGETLTRNPTDSYSATKTPETGNKLSGVEFALYGELSGLSEDQQLDILDYVRFKKHQWENRS